MEAYLTEPRTSDTKSLHAKGPLLYWEAALQTRPRLARMALDFLSAPGQYNASVLKSQISLFVLRQLRLLIPIPPSHVAVFRSITFNIICPHKLSRRRWPKDHGLAHLSCPTWIYQPQLSRCDEQGSIRVGESEGTSY